MCILGMRNDGARMGTNNVYTRIYQIYIKYIRRHGITESMHIPRLICMKVINQLNGHFRVFVLSYNMLPDLGQKCDPFISTHTYIYRYNSYMYICNHKISAENI